MEIVLASHSNLAVGMKETAEFIMGRQEKLHVIAAYIEDEKSVVDELTELVSQFGNEAVLFLTDLKGGSVNRIISEYILEREDYYLISGMNLALVLELLMLSYEGQRSEVMAQLKEIVVNASKDLEVIDVDELSVQADEDF
ncbi:PTS sugar transporter subunit IIA [Candidatus Enterococcus murrayae]|uniref:PTS EIIA type-4 domain-containing protein n=1 Tax=Candidatus Enterococcus murrayae TaxID=2815321 RepID=A0ABS3HKS7_9ENTE|nr:hypothetical protein [Enterococcus sp. MJM16]MBO0453510.1 hypothetical protein [Enterococcus sp. MJM16]